MTFVAVAIGGSALIGGAVALSSASKQAAAAKEAAGLQADATTAASEAQLTATRENIAFQKEGLAQQREDQAPYRAAGQRAIDYLSGGAQAGNEFNAPVPFTRPGAPTYTPFGEAEFMADPSYKFRVAEGLKALDRTASARGNLVSGRALKEVQRYGQDSASQEYQAAYGRHTTDYGQQLAEYDRRYTDAVQQYNTDTQNTTNRFNRLASIAGTGQTSTQQIAGATGDAYANIGASTLAAGQQVGSNLRQAGNAYASGVVGAAQARSSGYSGLAQAGNSLAQYKFLSNLNDPSYGASYSQTGPVGLGGGGYNVIT